jgi:alkyl hydroperoxide reductase subunit AhpC
VIMTGVVRHITVNDINVGRNVDEILRLIKAHQFVEVSATVLAVRLSCT